MWKEIVDISPYFRLIIGACSRAGKPQAVCGHVQALPARCSVGRERVSFPVNPGHLLPVRRGAAVSAVGSFLGGSIVWWCIR